MNHEIDIEFDNVDPKLYALLTGNVPPPERPPVTLTFTHGRRNFTHKIWFQRPNLKVVHETHAFTPNFDMACDRCGKGPEGPHRPVYRIEVTA